MTLTTDGGDTDDSNDLALIAHQGFAHSYPPNTLAAMRGAADDGADMIEIDLQPCADGEIVVFHDASLGSTTDAEVHDSGETVPTLDAAMAAIPSKVGVNVELKSPGRSDDTGDDRSANGRWERWVPLAERTLDVCSEYDNSILLSSFHPPALAAAREVDATVPLAVLFADAVDRAFTAARRYDCVGINPSIGRTDRALVERARTEGLDVNPYTVTKPTQTARLRRLGVDGVIADSASVLDS